MGKSSSKYASKNLRLGVRLQVVLLSRLNHIMYERLGSPASKTLREAHILLLNEDPFEDLDQKFMRILPIGVP